MKIKRIIYVLLGFISLGLGIIGIILPILPTVPFFLLTTFFFSRGSKRFDDWFKSTKLYKKHMENFLKNRVMTLRGKIVLLSLVSLMLFVSMWFVNNIVVSSVLLLLIVLKYLYFIFKIKTVSKEEYQILRGNKRA